MPAPRGPSRSHPTIKTIAASWRSLTGGKPVRDPDRRTLIACSGGADSAALAIALAAAAGRSAPTTLVVAHVVHDIRPPEQTRADRDSAAALAEKLNLLFVDASIGVRSKRGNTEAVARRLRYRALATLAKENNCPFVATAHHADDQLETLLMRLMRGAGPRGLRAVHAARPLTPSCTLVRPMLGVTRDEAQSLCKAARWQWQTDATNADQSRLRSAIRHQILPALHTLRPRAGVRASRAAAHLAELYQLLAHTTESLFDQADQSPARAHSWPRSTLRHHPAVVVGELVRLAHQRLVHSADALPERTIASIVKVVRAPSGQSKHFEAGGLRIDISATALRIRAKAPKTP